MCIPQLLSFGSSYVNRELKKIKKWLDANRLALNITKTNYVIFHSPCKMIDQFIRIKLGSKSIDRANFVKYLGILFDSTLSWKPHVTERSKKLAKTSGILFKIRHYVSHETLRLLYYSLFYSFISYGISVWGLTHPTVLDPLYKLQEKVVRAITFNNKYTHTTPLFYNLLLLKIHEIHSLKILCFVYDCKQGSPLQPFNDYYIPVHSIHYHNTRQASKGDIFISSVNTTQYGKRTDKFAGSIYPSFKGVSFFS